MAPPRAAAAPTPTARLGIWARVRRFLKPPRRLKFTREGRYFFFISLGIGFAAVNTGNNLLYLLLGMTLSLIVASGVLSELTLRKLEVRRQLPAEIFARRPFLVGVELRNRKRRAPSFSIEIEDVAGGKLLEKKCYFLKVPAGRSQHTTYRYTHGERGRLTFESVRLSTKFPFALFRKSRELELPAQAIVYPAIVDVADIVAGARLGHGESSSGRVGRGDDFYGVREFRPGDDPREVHWRLSAKVGRMVLREREDASTRRMTIYLDNRAAVPSAPAARQAVEVAISRAASLACHYLEDGYRVRLVTRTDQVGEGTGRSHLRLILRTLALLTIVAAREAAPLQQGRDPHGILVAPRLGSEHAS